MQTVTIPEALQIAIRQHQAGRLAEAEAIYRQILAQEPNHADALHLLGVIAHQCGRDDLAVGLIRQAIALVPNVAAFHSNLGEAHRNLGQLDQAIAAYRTALQLKPDYGEACNNLGNALRGKGELDSAVAAYRDAVRFIPDFADAHYNLGIALKDLDQPDQAIAEYRTAIRIKPGYTAAHNNLGNALREQGRLDEAAAAYRAALELDRGSAETCNNLGAVLKEQGKREEALAAYRTATQLKPDFAEAHYNAGCVLAEAKDFEHAIPAFRTAVGYKPDLAEAHYNLGIALGETDRLKEAVEAYQAAIQIKPDLAEAHYNLGNALTRLSRLDEAVAAFRATIQFKPGDADAHNNLGVALKDQGQAEEAIAAYRTALQLRPDFAEAHNNLGNALRDTSRLDEAIAACRAALRLRPDLAEAYNNMGDTFKNLGQVAEGVAAHRRAVELKPDNAEFHSNLLFDLHYLPGFDPQVMLSEHRSWNERHAEPLAKLIVPHANDANPGRRLRVGYVSADFRGHSVALFIENVLEHHDREQAEIFCYSNVLRPDTFTAHFQKYPLHWRNITGTPEPQVADLIRQDRIDILVDLGGHTARNRLLVFARKPAPVQISYLGYMDTTGMSTMDYRLTDAHADPPGTTEHLHTERLIRLPDSFACFRPVSFACFRPVDGFPPVVPLPALARGCVTFASFHTMAKLNDALLERWAMILRQVTGSRLMLVNAGLDEASCRVRLSEFFAGKGIDSSRLEFRGRHPLQEFLALHNEVDLLLDSHPYSGHTVCCHALWMGVPVVTLPGERHYSRMVASVLINLGLPELIAQTPEEYATIVGELAGDLPRLAALRSTLRDRMKASPVMAAAPFTRNVEQAYRKMWRAWCANPS